MTMIKAVSIDNEIRPDLDVRGTAVSAEWLRPGVIVINLNQRNPIRDIADRAPYELPNDVLADVPAWCRTFQDGSSGP